MSTKGCRILSYQEPVFLEFNWKGLDPFATMMNEDNHLTVVSVRLEQANNGCTVILSIQDGDTEEWTSAKQWHIVVAWEQLLTTLK